MQEENQTRHLARMSGGKLRLIGLIYILVVIFFVSFSWMKYQAQPDTSKWIPANGVVSELIKNNLNRGTQTIVEAEYKLGEKTYKENVLSVRDVWNGERFVTPEDTPKIGEEVKLKYDPLRPSRVILSTLPMAPFMTIWEMICLGILFILGMICCFLFVNTKRVAKKTSKP